jgi:hypothetical protein
VCLNNFIFSELAHLITFGRQPRWSDDDSGGVAGPNDEPTMPKGA